MKRFYAMLLALIMIFTLCACGAASSAKQESAPAEPAAAMDMAYTMNTAGGFGMAEEAVEAEMRSESGGSDAPENNPEKIIYSADATLETTEFDAALSGVLALVEKYGGWVESSSINGANYYNISRGNSYNRSAYYVLRVPGDKFQTMMNSLSELGNVPYTHIYTENVTAQYYDTQARLTAYEAQEARLVEMMAIAETVEDIIAIEDKLTDIRYRIDSLQTSLNNWDRRVNYSTLSLSVEEVREYTPDEKKISYGQELWMAFTDAIEGVGEFFKNALVFIVSAIPALVIIAVLIIVLRPLLKKQGAKCKERREKKAEARLIKKCADGENDNCYESPVEENKE
ncbi:MAG: DUF4349 domain-containing protein [Oscillospiraceae bacterium]|nr:DUF4349 domain-containing protein [Oscillospiraceae bacterium]